MVSDLVSSTGRRLRFWRRRGGRRHSWVIWIYPTKVMGGRGLADGVCARRPTNCRHAPGPLSSSHCPAWQLQSNQTHQGSGVGSKVMGRTALQTLRQGFSSSDLHSLKSLLLVDCGSHNKHSRPCGLTYQTLPETLFMTRNERLFTPFYFSATAHISCTVPHSRSVAASKVSALSLFAARHMLFSWKIWIICIFFCDLSSKTMLAYCLTMMNARLMKGI